MIALLDTNILIASTSEDDGSPDLGDFEDLRVSSLTWAELTKGFHAAPTVQSFRERRARLSALMKTFGNGIPFDDECLEAYDTVLARVVASGSAARSAVMDRMIAATALAHGLTLVSRDRGGFAGLEDLLAIEQR